MSGWIRLHSPLVLHGTNPGRHLGGSPLFLNATDPVEHPHSPFTHILLGIFSL